MVVLHMHLSPNSASRQQLRIAETRLAICRVRARRELCQQVRKAGMGRKEDALGKQEVPQQASAWTCSSPLALI
jgi:hypothetical protein